MHRILCLSSLQLLPLIVTILSIITACAAYSPHGQACVTSETQKLPFCDPKLPQADRVADCTALCRI
jgi:hypothetical protein